MWKRRLLFYYVLCPTHCLKNAIVHWDYLVDMHNNTDFFHSRGCRFIDKREWRGVIITIVKWCEQEKKISWILTARFFPLLAKMKMLAFLSCFCHPLEQRFFEPSIKKVTTKWVSWKKIRENMDFIERFFLVLLNWLESQKETMCLTKYLSCNPLVRLSSFHSVFYSEYSKRWENF